MHKCKKCKSWNPEKYLNDDPGAKHLFGYCKKLNKDDDVGHLLQAHEDLEVITRDDFGCIAWEK